MQLQKNAKEKIKEKLDRSADNERRRCSGSMWYSRKTGVLNLGEAGNSPLPEKKLLNLNIEEKKKSAEKRCFRHPSPLSHPERRMPQS